MKYIVSFVQRYFKTAEMEIEAESEEEINKMLEDEEYDEDSIWRKSEPLFKDGKEPVPYSVEVRKIVTKEEYEKQKKEKEDLPF